MDDFLAYEIHAALGHRGSEPALRIRVERRADEWLVAGKAEDRISEGANDRKLVHVGDDGPARLSPAMMRTCTLPSRIVKSPLSTSRSPR